MYSKLRMNSTTIIGIGASILTGISMLPQLIKLIKEKKAEDISLVMLGTLITGLLLWIYYGIVKDDWIITISNSVSAIINLLVLILSLVYKRKT
jgi:MtN3 and saliva related transmembrane protein